MKRYISAILIPSFLLQLFAGCYSATNITSDKLKYLESDERIKFTTKSKEEYVTDTWEVKNDTLKFESICKIEDSTKNKLNEAYKNYGKPNVYNVEFIPISEIETLSFQEFDPLMTILVSAVVIGAMTRILLSSKFWGIWN